MEKIIKKQIYEATVKNLSAKIDGSGRMLFINPTDISGSMTWNANWTDFDCSSLVPTGTEAVVLAVDISSGTISFRRNGDSANLVNVTPDGVVIIPLDDDLLFEQKGPAAGTKVVNLYGYVT